jgi:hypothetical protein
MISMAYWPVFVVVFVNLAIVLCRRRVSPLRPTQLTFGFSTMDGVERSFITPGSRSSPQFPG